MNLCRNRWQTDVRLDGKTAIITGSNTGLGKYNALDFYRRGCHVIMACRSLEKGEQAKEDIMEELEDEDNLGTLEVEKLDLASLSSVRQFAQTILDKGYPIHILVNNAGVMGTGKTFTEDGYELHFGTNHLGHFLLTLLLLNRIIESAPARIVNVSSLAHAIGRINFNDINFTKKYSSSLAYAQSKLANILFTKELARRLEGKDVNVYAVHPGTVKTEIGRHLKKKFPPALIKVYDAVSKAFLRTVKEGTRTQLYCSLDEDAGMETGLYYSNCRVSTPSRRARNMETAKKLWELSLIMVGLEDFDPLIKEQVPEAPKHSAREKKLISLSNSKDEYQTEEE